MRDSATSVQLSIKTKLGEFSARYSAAGLAQLRFPSRINKARAANPASKGISARVRGWHQLTVRAVQDVLAGNDACELPPLDLSVGTDFQRAVWTAMRKIPAGKTPSYGEIAAQIGRPKAVRAVGGACGANPIPILIPCHRVLAANRKIGGFSGGLDWKRTLLAGEGVRLVEFSGK